MSGANLRGVLPDVPPDVADSLEREFGDLEARYARGDWDPANLKGGRFAEALLRYLEWKRTGGFTPIGAQLSRKTIINQVENDASLPDGLRFHVRRCADLLLDVRNKRDVGHLGADVDVKAMDSGLVMALASWSLAEIIREESGLGPHEVQQLVDRLSAKQVPLVEEVGGDLLIVATHLSAADRTLVALYHSYPDPVPVAVLRDATRYQNVSRYRTILAELAKSALLHIKDDGVHLTHKGVAWVEKNIEMRMEV